MHAIVSKNQRGLSLIETIIYIALFSLMIGSLVFVSFQLMQNSRNTGSRVVTQEEINFVLKKINWALTGATDISVPSSEELTIANPNIPGGSAKIEFDDANDKITLDDEDITTINVRVDSLVFTHILAVGSSPEGVNIGLSIGGQTTALSKYLKI